MKRKVALAAVAFLLAGALNATPGPTAAQESCPVSVSASGPLGIVLGSILAIGQVVLSKFLDMQWDAANETCNITGLSSEGESLVAYLGEMAKYGSRLVAELFKLLSGG